MLFAATLLASLAVTADGPVSLAPLFKDALPVTLPWVAARAPRGRNGGNEPFGTLTHAAYRRDEDGISSLGSTLSSAATTMTIVLGKAELGDVSVLFVATGCNYSGQDTCDKNEVWALPVGKDGRLIDAALLHRADRVYKKFVTATLQPDGTIVRDDGEPARISRDGKVCTQAGSPVVYADPKSKEELTLNQPCGERQVLYRAKPGKPAQYLPVDKEDGDVFTVHFGSSPKPYILTVLKDGAEVTCRNPDNTEQTFVRRDEAGK